MDQSIRMFFFIDNIFRFVQPVRVSALGRTPSAVGYQPTWPLKLGLRKGFHRPSQYSVQAVYVPADDLQTRYCSHSLI